MRASFQLPCCLLAASVMAAGIGTSVVAVPPSILSDANLADLLSQQPGGQGYEFGSTVDVDGDVMVVTASNTSATGIEVGPRVYVYQRTGGDWQRVARLSVSSPPAVQSNFGLATIDGDLIAVSFGNANDLKGATYLYQRPVSGWTDMTETAVLTASDGQPGDQFGHARISGDTVVVSARYHDHGVINGNQGALYVFEKPVGGWMSATQTAKLSPQPLLNSGQLGWMVAIDGPVIVASSQGTSGEGRMYVFEKPLGGWANMNQTALLTHTGNINSLGMASVRIQGDTIVASGSTAVGVFVRAGANWANMTQTARLTASGGAAEAVGGGIAIDDDVVACGATGADNGVGGSDTGAVYIFEKPVAGWTNMTETAKLTALAPTASEQAGHAIDIDDGAVYVGIGLADSSASATNDGRVDIYEPPVGGWANAHPDYSLYMQPLGDLSQGDQFGFSVRAHGDIAVVGAHFDDGNALNEGAAYVFVRDGSTWTRAAKLTPSDPSLQKQFGAAVGVHGDTVAVGCGGSFQHPVYVFEKPASGWADMTETARLTTNNPASSAGRALSVTAQTIVVGAPNANSGRGAAFLYVRPGSGWIDASETMELVPGVTFNSGDGFGFALAAADDAVFVTAYQSDFGGSNRGSAYAFIKPRRGWTGTVEIVELMPSDPTNNARFGQSIACAEASVIIGAPGLNLAGGAQGIAYVYQRPARGWAEMTETARLTMASPFINSFGVTVAISDQAAVVGSLFSGASGRGFVFVRPPAGWASMTETARLATAMFTANDSFAGNVALAGHQAIVTAAERNGSAGGEQGGAFVFDLHLDDCNTNGVADLADIAAGTSRDTNANLVPDECEVPPCLADTNGDNAVNVTDLLAVISEWGACDPDPAPCPADINGDLTVNVTDLLAVISGWGACP